MTAGIPRAGYHSVTPRLVVSDVVAEVEFSIGHSTYGEAPAPGGGSYW